MGCQTELGSTVTNLHTPVLIPLDIRAVLVSLSDNAIEEDTYFFCTDCLIVAQKAGVEVFKNGEKWKPEGFLLRAELKPDNAGDEIVTPQLPDKNSNEPDHRNNNEFWGFSKN